MSLNRRSFLTSGLKLGLAGVLAPEWILDPPKGRSMISVPSRFLTTWTPLGISVGTPLYPELLESPLRKIFFEAARDVPPEYIRWFQTSL